MPKIKLIGSNKMLLENTPSSTAKFIKEKNIFYTKDENGIILDNYRAMKFFLTRAVIRAKKITRSIDNDKLWELTNQEKYKEIWTAVEKPILINFMKDVDAQKKIIRLYLSQSAEAKNFEKNRQEGTYLYKIDCFGNILEYKIVKAMNTMYEIKCLNKNKKNQRLHYKLEEFWYTKKGVLREAKNRLDRLTLEIKELDDENEK